MKFTKRKSRSILIGENLQHQLRCASTRVDLQNLSERDEKQIRDT